MAGKTVWIKNNRKSSIKVRGVHDGGAVEVLFNRESVNRLTREVENRGYTPIDIEVHEALLASSKIYKSMVDKGDLQYLEVAPDEAFSDAQRIVNLETKITGLEDINARLLRENEELKSELIALKKAEKPTKAEKPAKAKKPADSAETAGTDEKDEE